MQVRLNHKGPGSRAIFKEVGFDYLIQFINGLKPLLVSTEEELDFLNGYALIMGKPITVHLWGTTVHSIPEEGKFFTYVEIPLNQGEN